MISIPCSVLHTFRSLIRRDGLHKRHGAEPCFSVIAGPDGYRIRAASTEVAIEFQHPGQFDGETILLPVKALDAWDGRDNEQVTLEQRPQHRALASWSDRGVPRQAEFRVDAKVTVNFPEPPTTFMPNEPGLWPALRSAAAASKDNSTRYALSCLHFRGSLGQIDATDGRQILSQTGFTFGFEDSVLVPALPILGCRELDLGEQVAVGRAGDWIGFGVGHWLVLLRINKDGRFPQVDDILPNHEFARSRLELSASDAEFLGQLLPQLAVGSDHDEPITLDLNGRVLIRSRESEESRSTEVELTSSRLTGEPVAVSMNRRYIERAMKLGFRDVFVYGAESPLLCRDERRRFLWALLDPTSVVPRGDDPIRIESPLATTPFSTTPRPTKESKMTASESTAPAASTPVQSTQHRTRTKRARPAATGSSIEQAIALRDALLVAMRQANELARTLKRQRRQERIVANTLASLKVLQ